MNQLIEPAVDSPAAKSRIEKQAQSNYFCIKNGLIKSVDIKKEKLDKIASSQNYVLITKDDDKFSSFNARSLVEAKKKVRGRVERNDIQNAVLCRQAGNSKKNSRIFKEHTEFSLVQGASQFDMSDLVDAPDNDHIHVGDEFILGPDIHEDDNHIHMVVSATDPDLIGTASGEAIESDGDHIHELEDGSTSGAAIPLASDIEKQLELEPFDDVKPATPRVTTEVDRQDPDLEALWAWSKQRLPVFVEPKLEGKQISIHKEGDKVEANIDDTFLAEFKNLDHDYIIDAVLTSEGELLLVDLPYLDEDLHRTEFRTRRERLESVFAEGFGLNDKINLVNQTKAQTENDLRQAIKDQFDSDRSDSVVVKSTPGDYPLEGKNVHMQIVTAENPKPDLEQSTVIVKENEVSDSQIIAMALFGIDVKKESELNNTKDPKEVVEKQFGFNSTNKMQQIAYSVVLEEGSFDKDGNPVTEDFGGDFMTAEEVEAAAHRFLKKKELKTKFRHKGLTSAQIVESLVVRPGDVYNGVKFDKTSWIVGLHIPNKAEWKKVESGEINAVSIGGLGLRNKI